jgi:hypothetical protein
MAKEFLRITPETTWGVYDASATGVIIADLEGANAFTGGAVPKRVSLPTAAAYNRRAITFGRRFDVGGALKMILRGSQGATIASWVDAGGAARPASMTIDHGVLLEDGTTIKRYRFLGMLAKDATFTADSSSNILHLALSLVGKSYDKTITATDFPEPAATDYASDALYAYEQLGALKIGSNRAEFDKFQLKITNHLDVRFNNPGSQWASRATYCGRNVDWDAELPYLTTIDRDDYESITAVAGSVTFTNGAHSLAFDMKSSNFYGQVTDNLDMSKTYLQALKMESYWNAADATDFGLTAS